MTCDGPLILRKFESDGTWVYVLFGSLGEEHKFWARVSCSSDTLSLIGKIAVLSQIGRAHV